MAEDGQVLASLYIAVVGVASCLDLWSEQSQKTGWQATEFGHGLQLALKNNLAKKQSLLAYQGNAAVLLC